MPHALTPNLEMCYLHTASVTDDALVAYALELSTVAFVLFCGPEYSFTEKSVSFRPQCPVVDGLGFFHLPIGPFSYDIRRSKLDLDLCKLTQTFHMSPSVKD